MAWDNLGSDWTIAHENNECTVLYYNKVLPSGYATSAFTKSLTVYIDDTVMSDYEVKESPDKKSIEYTYRYDGSSFQIEVEVDAVQEHNAADAIMSAWGIPAAVSGGTLSVQPY